MCVGEGGGRRPECGEPPPPPPPPPAAQLSRLRLRSEVETTRGEDTPEGKRRVPDGEDAGDDLSGDTSQLALIEVPLGRWA